MTEFLRVSRILLIGAETAEFLRVPRIRGAVMTEFLRVPRIRGAETPQYSRVLRVPGAEMTGHSRAPSQRVKQTKTPSFFKCFLLSPFNKEPQKVVTRPVPVIGTEVIGSSTSHFEVLSRKSTDLQRLRHHGSQGYQELK